MIYLDTSALVKLVINELETTALEARLDGHEADVATSELAITELIRVVRRSCYNAQRALTVPAETLDERLAAAGDVLDRVDHIIVDTDTFVRAGMFADDPHLGSLDAIHLVCALEIGPTLAAFISYDKPLTRAAAARGMPVEQPS